MAFRARWRSRSTSSAPAASPSATPASSSRCGSSASRPARRALTSTPACAPRARSPRAAEPAPEMLDVARVQTALAAHHEALALTPDRMIPGHRVGLLFGGAQAYPAMLDAIASARSEIL